MASVISPPRPPASDSTSWLPEPAEFVLDNGLRLIFARRDSPIVEMRFVVGQGFAAEPRQRSGLAGLAMAMFTQSALRVGGARLDSLAEPLGAAFGGRVMADGAIIEVSALRDAVPDVLMLCAQLLANPEFDADGFERARANRMALIARERRSPLDLALRILPAALYGDGHPYARPLSGSGIEPSVAAVTADDLREYYAANLAPERVTLVIAGPPRASEAKRLVESALGRWRSPAAASPEQTGGEGRGLLSKVVADSGPAVTIVDRPEMQQMALAMGLPTAARSTHTEALMVADAIIAGTFSSRLNLRLREERGWTYGVRSSLIDARLGGVWLINSFVDRDWAVAAMAEIAREVDNLAGAQPCLPSELRHAVDHLVARAPSSFETCAQLADALACDAILRLPSGHRRSLSARLRALDCGSVTEVCQRIRTASAPHWVIVGDARDTVERLRGAGFVKIDMLRSGDPQP